MVRTYIPEVSDRFTEGHALIISGGTVRSDSMPVGIEPQAAISSLGNMTVTPVEILGISVPLATSTEAAVDALQQKVDAILVALRSAGVLEA